MVFTFPVVVFGAVVFLIGGARVMMPMIRSGLTRSRKRRRSKHRRNRKDRPHTPRQKIDIVAAPGPTEALPGSPVDTG